MVFISYAQNLEDVMLFRALKNIEHGYYIDVGAQHPICDSVTKAFYDRGWHGLNIEPVAEYFNLLKQHRVHDINLQVALNSFLGEIPFYEVSHTGISTTNKIYAEQYAVRDYEIFEHVIPCTTLNDICEKYKMNTVHFLKVDVEGSEKAVLEGFAFVTVRPWIVVIESNEPNTTRDISDQWKSILLNKGYESVYYDGLNRFYVANEHSELKEHFHVPPNIFDQYVPYSQYLAQQKLIEEENQVESITKQLENETDQKAYLTDQLLQNSAQQVILSEQLAEERNRNEFIGKQLVDESIQRVSLSKQLAQEHAQKEDLSRLLAEVRNQKEAFLKQLVHEQTQKEDLSKLLAEVRNQKEALSNQLVQEQVQKDILSKQLAEANAQKDTLATQLQQLRYSLSWRLTAPLRKGRNTLVVLMARPNKIFKRIIRNMLRFLLRYGRVLKLGRWLLRRYPKIRGKLLGMAELTTPYVPKAPAVNTGISERVERLSEPARATYDSLQELYHKHKINNN